MANLNRVQLMGHLGQDPESRATPNGKSVANLSLATSERWNDKATGEKREKTEWHRVVMFERLADLAVEYLRKGSPVFIEGKLQTRKWQDKDGADRYTTEIVAQSMQFLGSKPSGGERAPRPASAPAKSASDDFDDDIPF